jgi:XTP/dITP diphosphohydrolase
MKTKSRLLLATKNNGKAEEIQAVLRNLDVELVLPRDIGLDFDVEEDGKSYAENAAKKALAFMQASGLISIADDTGLEVDALEGKPGLHSNRFGPKPYTDESRRTYLLQELKYKPRPWVARFRATVAVVSPKGGVRFVEGVCPGEIVPDERGESGFGYDPIFLLEDINKTMAELEIEQKNRLSHRGQALQKAIPILIEIFEAT